RIGRTPEEGGEAPDIADVVALGLAAKVPHVHIVDHALAQRADRGNGNELVHRSTPWLKEAKCSACVGPCSIQTWRPLLYLNLTASAHPAQRVRSSAQEETSGNRLTVKVEGSVLNVFP